MSDLVQSDFQRLIEIARQASPAGNRLTALASLETASALDPSKIGIKLEIANELRELGRVDEAETVLRSMLLSEPKHFRAHVELGQLLRRRGDRLAALASFETASALDSSKIGIKLEIANELRELGRVDEAETVLRSVLLGEPKHFRAHVELGHLLRQRGDLLAALVNFETASALDPSKIGIKLEIANELRELGRVDEAETVLRSVLLSEPDHFRAHVELGHLLRRRGDRLAALAKFETASALDPSKIGIKLEIANELRGLGRVDAAETLLRKVLATEPRHVGALVGLGSLLTDTWRLDEAELVLNRAVKFAPQSPAPLMGLGFVARQRGDRSASLHHFASILANNPNHSGAILETAAELRERGQFNEAHNLISELIARQPLLLSAWMHRGLVYRREGFRENALETFETIAKTFPDHVQTLVEIAIEQRALGNPFEAKRLLLNALALLWQIFSGTGFPNQFFNDFMGGRLLEGRPW